MIVTRETAIKRRVIAHLRKRYGREIYIVKQTSVNAAGTPDLLVCYRGRFVAMELKTAIGGPEKLQEQRIAEVEAAGGLAGIVRCPADADELLGKV